VFPERDFLWADALCDAQTNGKVMEGLVFIIYSWNLVVRRAQLVLGWVTCLWARKTILVYHKDQLSMAIPSQVGMSRRVPAKAGA